MRGAEAPTWAGTDAHAAHRRISGDSFFRDRLPLDWELNPFRMLNEKMAAQPVFPTLPNCRRNIFDEIRDAELAWGNLPGLVPVE
eukprot:3120866-Alexandrium_andersonii.AAC.1